MPAARSSTRSPGCGADRAHHGLAPGPVRPSESTSLVTSYRSATSSNIAATSCGCFSNDARPMRRDPLTPAPRARVGGGPAPPVRLRAVTQGPLRAHPGAAGAQPGTKGAHPAASTALVVRTERVELPAPLLDLLPAEHPLAWVRGGDGLVGWGEAARLEVTGPGPLRRGARLVARPGRRTPSSATRCRRRARGRWRSARSGSPTSRARSWSCPRSSSAAAETPPG